MDARGREKEIAREGRMEREREREDGIETVWIHNGSMSGHLHLVTLAFSRR